ncbi:hypothetical protein JCM6882_004284 [Rhodosporidiobolus microsporus]
MPADAAADKPKPKLVNQRVDASYHVVISCDVKVDLSHPKLDVKFPLKDVPLAGTWAMNLKRAGDAVNVSLDHRKLDFGRLGMAVETVIEVSCVDNGVKAILEEAAWEIEPCPAKREDGRIFTSRLYELAKTAVLEGQRRYRFTFTFKQQTPGLNAASLTPDILASRVCSENLEAFPPRVRLFFPAVGGEGAELWVSGSVVSKAVPYFKDLLSSDFSEATPRRAKRARQSGAAPLPLPPHTDRDFDDSDDETDAFLFSTKPPQLDKSAETSDLSFREISITQTAFSTYHALLVYVETGFVHFAPLRSASSPSDPSASFSRKDFISQKLNDKLLLPVPVSPKSLFRLADLLRLPDDDPLSALCLRAISDSLTHHSAAHELFSDVSVCHDEVRKVVLEYVVKNWDAVSETQSWKETMDKIHAGEMPETAPVLIELMRAREAAAKA